MDLQNLNHEIVFDFVAMRGPVVSINNCEVVKIDCINRVWDCSSE